MDFFLIYPPPPPHCTLLTYTNQTQSAINFIFNHISEPLLLACTINYWVIIRSQYLLWSVTLLKWSNKSLATR